MVRKNTLHITAYIIHLLRQKTAYVLLVGKHSTWEKNVIVEGEKR